MPSSTLEPAGKRLERGTRFRMKMEGKFPRPPKAEFTLGLMDTKRSSTTAALPYFRQMEQPCS